MNENPPKVTVITATFNLIKNGREKFFRQNIESVHNQTYKNVEHIIIDGASTDGTLELLKEYADKRYIKYYSEPDECMCDAMNKGIKRASGKYVAILNSDDYYIKEAIELSVEALERENADYSYSSTNMLSRKDDKLLRIWQSSDDYFARFFLLLPFNHETMLCKKEVYEKQNYYDWKKYGTASDCDFVNRLILNDYKRAFISTPILNFRMDGSTNFTDEKSISNSYKLHVKNCQKVYNDLWSNFLMEGYLRKLMEIQNENSLEAISHSCILYMQQNFLFDKIRDNLLDRKLKNFPYDALNKWLSSVDTEILRFNFLSFFPIYKIKKKYIGADGVNKKHYLFNVVPFLKIETRKMKTNVKLFSFIPLLTIKKK